MNFINLFGQNKLILEHKNKPSKIKHLNLDISYYLKTKDTIYKSAHTVSFNDSTIFIPILVYSGKDTTYKYLKKVKRKDSTFSYTSAIYKIDTIPILINDIQIIKLDLFKNRQWLSPFAHAGMAGIFGILVLPIVAITDGKDGVKKWAQFEAAVFALSFPPIFVGTRKIKYNLEKKWTLKVI